MVKTFLIGDLHLGIRRNSSVWFDYFKETYEQFLKPKIEENKNSESDKLIILGDIFHERYSICNKTLSQSLEIFEDLSKVIQINIIVGNHDLYSNASHKYTSLDILKPFATVYKDPTIIDDMLLIPWITNDKKYNINDVITEKLNPKIKYVLAHADFEGISSFGFTGEHDSTNTISCYKHYKDVTFISGHIHSRQQKQNMLHVGGFLNFDFGDVNNQKGVYILENDELSFVPNNVSPKFVSMKLKDFLCSDFDDFCKNNTKTFLRIEIPADKKNKVNNDLLKTLFKDVLLDVLYKKEKVIQNKDDQNIESNMNLLFNFSELNKILDKFIDGDEWKRNKIDNYLNSIIKK